MQLTAHKRSKLPRSSHQHPHGLIVVSMSEIVARTRASNQPKERALIESTACGLAGAEYGDTGVDAAHDAGVDVARERAGRGSGRRTTNTERAMSRLARGPRTRWRLSVHRPACSISVTSPPEGPLRYYTAVKWRLVIRLFGLTRDAGFTGSPALQRSASPSNSGGPRWRTAERAVLPWLGQNRDSHAPVAAIFRPTVADG